MKFFTNAEIFRSIYLSLLFGVFLSTTHISANFLSVALRKMLLVPYNTIKLSRRFSIKYIIELSKLNCRTQKHRNLFDAILFSLFGILFILHFYVTSDGIFRLYVVVIVIFAFCSFQKFIGSKFIPILEKCFTFIYTIILFFCGFVTAPMYKITSLSVKIIQKLTEPLLKQYRLKKSKRIMAKKKKAIELLINN